MFFILGIWNGLGEIRAHKLRSSLTITCVLLGVASLVLIAGFITGLFQQWETYEKEMGWSEKVQVESQEVPEEQKNLQAISPGRTLADVRAIQRLSHYAVHVSPVCTLWPSMVYQGNSSNVDLRGVTPEVLPVDRYKVDRGRFFCDADLATKAPVIVLGSKPVKDLFKGHQDPLGQIVLVNREPFRVIGLLHDYVSMQGKYNLLEQKDQVAFVPITTMQQRLLGSNQVDELNVEVDNTDNLGRLVEEIESILAGTHRGVQDFKAYSPQQGVQQFNAMRAGFYMVGCGVGAITLLVGGIGIMNLMLASINERVREIGIRKGNRSVEPGYLRPVHGRGDRAQRAGRFGRAWRWE